MEEKKLKEIMANYKGRSLANAILALNNEIEELKKKKRRK